MNKKIALGLFVIFLAVQAMFLMNSHADKDVSEEVAASNLNSNTDIEASWEVYPGNDSSRKPEVSITKDASNNEVIDVTIAPMGEGEYFYSSLSKWIPAKADQLYFISMDVLSNIETSKDVIRITDGKNTIAELIQEGQNNYKLAFKTSSAADKFQVSLLAANAIGSREELVVKFSNIKISDKDVSEEVAASNLNSNTDIEASWEVYPGNDSSRKPEVSITKDASNNEVIDVTIAPMGEGEYFYSSLSKWIPAKADQLYFISMDVLSNIETSKDVIRITDGKNTIAELIQEGQNNYKLAFKTSSAADKFQVSLLAANAIGSREELVVKFSNIKISEYVKQKRFDEQHFPVDYDEYLDIVKHDYRDFLHSIPSEWGKGLVQTKWNSNLESKIFAEAPEIRDIEETYIEKIIEETPVLRKTPFPFFSTLSVPSDACGAYFSDAFYTQPLFEEYGLDFPASFVPFATPEMASDNGWQYNIFSSDVPTIPDQRNILFENQEIDAFHAFLISYYRGWTDHIHNWSNENSVAYTLFKPISVKASEKNQVFPLTPVGPIDSEKWYGLFFDTRVDEKIKSFEIKLTDYEEREHFVVFNKPLGNRPGWDVSTQGVDVKGFFLDFSDQENCDKLRGDCFVSLSDGGFKGAELSIEGAVGAGIKINFIRPFDITRNLIEKQMNTMEEFNIFPVVQTYHGGNSSWTSIFPNMDTLEFPQLDKNGKKFSFQYIRDPFGAEPKSKTYLVDLYKDHGIELNINAINNHKPTKIGICDFINTEKLYCGNSRWESYDSTLHVTEKVAHGENLGVNVVRFIKDDNHYGAFNTMYMHFDYFNEEVTEGNKPLHMHQMKSIAPFVKPGLAYVSNAKYNLDNNLEESARVWPVPISVSYRFQKIQKNLEKHLDVKDNNVYVQSWIDDVTEKSIPSKEHITQDLHGQTFYVSDANSARLFVDNHEVKSIKRNTQDFTGRESITVVDDSHPTLVFDDLDLYEINGRLIQKNASYFFRRNHALHGQYSMEIKSEKNGESKVIWKPFILDTFGTDYLRFSYKKTNPESTIFIAWMLEGSEKVYEASEADLTNSQGWKLPFKKDSDYHEVILDYADMISGDGSRKKVPRGRVDKFWFGLKASNKGDSVYFDRIEFLSARGVRSSNNDAFVVGGKLKSGEDDVEILLKTENELFSTVTSSGGWYTFNRIPKNSVAEIYFYRDDVKYSPARGRLAQIVKNDIEFDIWDVDERSPLIPRPINFVNKEIPKTHSPRSVNSNKKHKKKVDSVFKPHSTRFYAGLPGNKSSYMIEETVNNYGFIDKDRRFDNPDDALRVLIQGECWTEGQQTPLNEHVNVLLESILRRETGLPVEVIVTATSSSSPASWSLTFEKYGQEFKPDLVLLFLNAFNMAHIEPNVLKKLIGWDKEHSPYKMYDLDQSGNLLEYPPDMSYGAFVSKPDPTPIVEDASLTQMYFLSKDAHPILEKSFNLLEKILVEKYQSLMNPDQQKLGLITGYVKSQLPSEGSKYGQLNASYDNWMESLNSVTDPNQIALLDLSSELFQKDYTKMLWENDAHLTTTGNIIIAEALARKIMEMPRFKKLISEKAIGKNHE